MNMEKATQVVYISAKKKNKTKQNGGTICSAVLSAYLKRHSLGPKLFAFLVKQGLEGALNVLFSSLETL